MKPPYRKEDNSSITLQQILFSLSLFVLVAATLQAADQPSWWTSSGAVDDSKAPNDYAVANQGQLKQFTEKATLYLNDSLSNGAGSTLNGMVAGWSNYYQTNGYSAAHPASNDLRAINQGQLKTIANSIYPRLTAAGYTGFTPTWLATNSSDYKLANIGELKQVFNFTLDTDGDDLPDWWERQYLGDLDSNGYMPSPAGDGYTLAEEFQQNRNPLTSPAPILTIISGNNQSGTSGAMLASPLVVKTTDASGTALPNLIVKFEVSNGTGKISTSSTGASGLNSSLQLQTGSDGKAQVYFKHPLQANFSSTITATAGTSQQTFTETTPVHTGNPAAPSQFRGWKGINAGVIELNWQNNADNATYLLIQQSTNNSTWTDTVTLTDPNQSAYTVTGLLPGTNYYFRIIAGN